MVVEKRKKGNKIFVSVILTIIIITLMGNKYLFDLNADGKNVTIVSQESVDIYFPGASNLRDRTSMFVLRDELGNTFDAFCADRFNTNPPDGTVLNVEESMDERLLKVLYYGWKGPKQWDGFNDVPSGAVTGFGDTRDALVEAYARVATTMCATAVRDNVVPINEFAIPYWNYLFGDNPAPEVEKVSLSFSDTNPAVNLHLDENNMYQESEIIEVYGDSKYYTTIQIPNGITMHIKRNGESEYSAYASGQVDVSGGSCFYLTADINYTGDFSINNALINEKQYYIMTATPNEEGYQVLAALRLKNQYTNSLAVKFSAPKGRLWITKQTVNEGATKDNPSYSLEMAGFGIYTSLLDAESDVNRIDTIYTDSSGSAYKEGLTFGKYYIKELQSSKGYYINDTIYSVIINDEYEYSRVTVDEVPVIYPLDVLVKKQDDDGVGIKNVEFLVQYYKVSPDLESININEFTPDASYIMCTDSEGICRLSKEYKISGDEFFYTEDDKNGFPIGIITLKEISVPKEYIIDKETKIIPIGNASSDTEYVYNAPLVTNKEKKCKIKIYKTGEAEKDSKGLEGVRFSLYAKEDIKTSAGNIKYKSGELMDSLVTDEDGYAISKELYLGKYFLVEEQSVANNIYEINDDIEIDLLNDNKEETDLCYIYSVCIENKLKPVEKPEEKQEAKTEVLGATYIKTGDSTAINLLSALAGVSAFGIIIIAFLRKKLGK